jgi:hypothetical protein
MKVLILVQSIDVSNYSKIINLQKETWDSVENKDTATLFYMPDPNKTGIVGKNLYIKEEIAWELMYVHFMRACVHALKFEWDYIFKTDNSTYVDKERLVEVLENKPRQKYYGGHPFFKTHPEYNTPERNPVGIKDFMWGDGFVLSRDLVIKLVDKFALNPYYLRSAEDYCTAFVLRDACQPDDSLLISSYYDKDFSFDVKQHVYRCIPSMTNAELNYDQCRTAMIDIHKQLTHEDISASNVVRS